MTHEDALASQHRPAPTADGVFMEGYLFKRTTNAFKTWNRRWFTLENHQLKYRKRSGAYGRPPDGVAGSGGRGPSAARVRDSVTGGWNRVVLFPAEGWLGTRVEEKKRGTVLGHYDLSIWRWCVHDRERFV